VADGMNEFRVKERKVYFLDREGFTGYLEAQHTQRKRGQAVTPQGEKEISMKLHF
jgi:hypothetical protein